MVEVPPTTKEVENMFKYRVRCTAEKLEKEFRQYESKERIHIGDVIELHFFHCVVDVQNQKSGDLLVVAEGSLDAEEAALLAEQSEYRR